MIPKPDIKALIARITHHERGLHERQLIHPQRDWAVGVLLALVTVLSAGWWSAHTYFVNRDIEVEEETTVGTVMYREQLVKDVLTSYEERANTFSALLIQAPTPVIVDEPEPALPTTSTTSVAESETDAVTEDGPVTEATSSPETTFATSTE